MVATPLFLYRCPLPTGHYTYSVYATDSAGNRQVGTASDGLFVY